MEPRKNPYIEPENGAARGQPLSVLLCAVDELLQRAVKRHGAPLKLVIDTRGLRYAYTAYGSEREQFTVADIEQLST